MNRGLEERVPSARCPVPSLIAAIACVLLCGCSSGEGGGSGSRGPLFGRETRGAEAGREGMQILCAEFSGPDKMRLADDLGAALKRVGGIDARRVGVVHEAERSTITYGPYPPSYLPQGGVQITPELRRDLDLLHSLGINEQFPFLRAIVEPAATVDPGEPEWDLRKAPGVYTLQIGVFYNTAKFLERKEAAVEWVRDLRRRGYPAFYFHNNKNGTSSVNVGSFDESAVVTAGPRENRARSSADYTPPTTDYSQEVIQLRERDPEFRFNHVNGAQIKVNGVPQSSFLVRIPHPVRDETMP